MWNFWGLSQYVIGCYRKAANGCCIAWLLTNDSTHIIKMDIHSFQGFSSRMGTNIPYKMRDNNIAQGRGIVCGPVGNVDEVLDPSDGTKNRKQALFCINFF
jgi:hypothetical protein